jgi:serine/threonine protein phosphatase 1
MIARLREDEDRVEAAVRVAGSSHFAFSVTSDFGHLVCIDTYCHGSGWLTALDVKTGEVWQADKDGTLRRR